MADLILRIKGREILFRAERIVLFSLLSLSILSFIILYKPSFYYRFILMLTLTAAPLLAYLLSRLDRQSLISYSTAFMVVIAVLGVVQAETWGPTITLDQYRELEKMLSMIPDGSVVYGPMQLHYWIQYMKPDIKLVKPGAETFKYFKVYHTVSENSR